jgi:hypothetical protein
MKPGALVFVSVGLLRVAQSKEGTCAIFLEGSTTFK